MAVAASFTWAPFSSWSPGPLQGSVIGPSLLVNSYLEIKFHNKQKTIRPPYIWIT